MGKVLEFKATLAKKIEKANAELGAGQNEI